MGRRYALLVGLAIALAVVGIVRQAPAATRACGVAADPGYRMLFDGTAASFATWAHAGPGGFELRSDCTLRSTGGLGLLWYDARAFDSPLTLKVEWMVPGDANSGVFVGFPAVGNDPFVAVNQGYEVQIDPTDPSWTTASIYNFQAAEQARRDRALHPPGDWNTYEITVDAPRIVVRLNGVVVNRFVSTSAARQSLGHGFVGLQNHSDADHVSFRSVQVDEWGSQRPLCSGAVARNPGDAFSGGRLDGCRWNRIVRYDGGGLNVSGGALHLELSGDSSNLVLQPAPTGAWTIETSVRVPLRSGSQQAGLLAYRDDAHSLRLVAAASPGGRARLRLVDESGRGASAAVRRPQSDTYRLRLAKSGSRYTGSWSVDGVTWRRLGTVVERGLSAYGLVALGGSGSGTPPYAAFEQFHVRR